MTVSKDLLDDLLKSCERPEDLLGDAGLIGVEYVRRAVPGQSLFQSGNTDTV